MESTGSFGSTRRALRAIAATAAFALLIGWQVLAPSAALADGPTTFSNTAQITVPATGSPDQIGPASPYPSEIAVSGMSGPVTKVTVAFNNVGHGILNDIDALLVAPGGESLVVLSDASDENTYTWASDATLTFDDAAPGQIPGAGRVDSGSYQPTNRPYGDPDSFPSPAPTPSNHTTLAQAFSGINPNGTWKLFVVDDSTGDLGSMAGGWSLTITTEVAAVATTTTITSSDSNSFTGDSVTFTAAVSVSGAPVAQGSVQFFDGSSSLGAPVALNSEGVASLTTSALTEGTHLIRAVYSGATGLLTSNGTVSQRVDNQTVVSGNLFCNVGAIAGPQAGTATPYPSNIFVSGLSGSITKVTAELRGLSHTAPIDYDILLSGPDPTKNLFLLSDGGGFNPVSGIDLVFDDAAASGVAPPMTSGTFRPTRIPDESIENLPAPAPTPSSATALSTFNGGSANGTWSLWVVDDATGDIGSISGGWCLRITTEAPTSTALASTPNPSQLGQSVTFTATVTSGGSPVTAGTVQFQNGAANLGSPVAVAADGTASLTTSALVVGSHAITANYSGAAGLAASVGSRTQVVEKVGTTTALTSSVNPASYGQPVTLTATVMSGGSPVTAGTVQFRNGAANLGLPVAVAADGTASLTTSALGVGTHTIGADYSGTASLAASTGTLDQVVGLQTSGTAVTAAPSPSTFGESVTLTAAVTVDGAPVTSGTVQFSDGATNLGGPVALDGDGRASLSTSALNPGDHTITATFSGNSTIAGSANTTTHTVEKLTTEVDLVSSANPSSVGDDVVFTATVTSGASPVAVGEVTFEIDGVDVETVAVDGDGQAQHTASSLLDGPHTVVARYGGATNHAASESPQLTQQVRLVVDAGGPYGISEGDSVALAGTASASDAAYAWDVDGDGTFDAVGDSPVLSWAELEALGVDDGPGTHTVTLRVTTPRSQADATAVLTVANASPVTVVTGDLEAVAGEPFTIKVGADDPSSADMAAQFTYTLDWGDGSPVETVVGPADPPVTHTYAAAGSYAAVFTATDKDGGTGAGMQITVRAAEADTEDPGGDTDDGSDDRDDDSGDGDDDSHVGDELDETGAPNPAGILWIGLGALTLGAAAVSAGAIIRRRKN